MGWFQSQLIEALGVSYEEAFKLLWSDRQSSDEVAWQGTFAKSGDYIAVGPRQGYTNGGYVYIYFKTGGVWTEQQRISVDNGDALASQELNFKVQLDGNVLVVSSTDYGVSGNANVGCAITYTRSGTTWTRQNTIIDASNQGFGWDISLHMSSGRLAVTAINKNSGSNTNVGRVFMYETVDGGVTWNSEASLGPLTGSVFEQDGIGYGASIFLDDDLIAIGINLYDSVTLFDVGAVQIVKRDATLGWINTGSVRYDIFDDNDVEFSSFGSNVVLNGDDLFVSYPHGSSRDVVKYYKWDGASFILTQTIDVAVTNDGFGGRAVAFDGTTLVIGAYVDDSSTFNGGVVYTFLNIGGVWTQQQKLLASDSATQDFFGGGVLIDTNVIVVGAPGVDDPSSNEGAIYIFEQ